MQSKQSHTDSPESLHADVTEPHHLQVFKSAKLENGQLLTLATCGVDQYATSSSPTHRSKSALIRSRFTNRNVDIRKITLYASCNSPFWEKELMWG